MRPEHVLREANPPGLVAAGHITDSFTLASLALSGWASPPPDGGPGR